MEASAGSVVSVADARLTSFFLLSSSQDKKDFSTWLAGLFFSLNKKKEERKERDKHLILSVVV